MSLTRYGQYLTADPDLFYSGLKKGYNRIKDLLNEEPSFPGTGGKRKLPLGEPPKSSQKKRKVAVMAKNVSAVNALADRASMKMLTKKLKARRVKKVKVPKRLRKQIKQVLVGGELTGKYVTSRVNSIGFLRPDHLEQDLGGVPYLSINGVPVSPWHAALSTEQNSYNYTSWFVPLASDAASLVCAGGTAAAPANSGNFAVDDAFTYFHPLKFLDAASVLWNRKAIAPEGWITQTGNIQTRINVSTGAEGDTNRVSNVKFHIVNSFVEFELKNNSYRQLKVRIITCTPKVKVQNQYPLDVLKTGIAEDSTENGYLGGNGHIVNLSTPLFSPKDSPYFSGQYKYDMMEIIIKPGETCKHSLQGPKNVEFDTYKMLINKLDGEAYNMKGTKSVIMQVLPDIQVITSNFSPMALMGDADNSLHGPLCVLVKEHFLLKCPETAGFIKNNAAAAGMQTLNQKRKVTLFGNFASLQQGTVVYAGSDEQQPASGLSKSNRY